MNDEINHVLIIVYFVGLLSREKKYIHLTGDSRVNDDIIAFYRARQKLSNMT